MKSKIESILFVASKPLSSSQIAKALKIDKKKVEVLLKSLVEKFNKPDSGIFIIKQGEKYQMCSNPDNKETVEGFVKTEVTDELTRAQLETLSVIAYLGPITRPELEQVRGVNCAVIIRNLLIRGLIEEKMDKDKALPIYSISFEAMSHLGITDIKQLPDYKEFSNHEYVEKIFNRGD
ncbi:MAG: SMC-Scp complex subunit ScpB [Candidatus Magasanikbacteria bacterium]|nr:SMC-Scp complex subunit ScpB [Candidatus Magasanikbacteria bacterium]